MANFDESIEAASDFVDVEDLPGEQKKLVNVLGVPAESKKLKDFITCRHCKQEFDHDAQKPFLLPCLDAICKSCTQDDSTSENQGLECTECQSFHVCFQNGNISLQTDNTREAASKVLRLTTGQFKLPCEMCTNNEIASHRCVDCYRFICATCVKLHSALRSYKSHTVLEIKGLLTEDIECLSLFRSAIYCTVSGHENETLKMYCSDSSCLKPVCVQCCITTHKDHTFCNIDEVGKKSEAKLEYILKKVALKVNQAQESVTELQIINDKCLQDSLQLQNEIKTRFTEARKALEQREKNLCDAVAAHLNIKQRCIESGKKKLAFFLNSCDHASFYGNISPKINDHQSFIDIEKSIQIRLENLERQLIENQVTMDTIKFYPKPSDVAFITSISSFGKILVTKVSRTKSKVVIPQFCDLGKEVQIQIELYSSTGKPVVDENVCVYLKHDGKIFKTIKCEIGNSSPCFTGIWIPNKSLQLSWIVVSNGIELDTLEGVIDVKATTARKNKHDSVIGSSVDLSRKNNCTDYETATKTDMCMESEELSNPGVFKKDAINVVRKSRLDDSSSSTHMEGNLSQSVETYFSAYETGEKDVDKLSLNDKDFGICIPMSARDYEAVLYFGRSFNWFRRISYRMTHISGNFVCNLSGLADIDYQVIEKKVKELLQTVHMMSSECVLIENEDICIQKTIEKVNQKQTNVCLIRQGNDIEIISESYTELLEAKNILLHDVTKKRKMGRDQRRGRTFVKVGYQLENTIQDITNLNKMSANIYQRMKSLKEECKTTEGLIIKIYSGSITCLEVDCIVNEADENLMHSGGVAAAISEAAGYQFDQESKKYVENNGPIPVGSCCVTSAGKLSYKCVIHTVGPKWEDYRDKSQCLQLLQDSVKVTFEEADYQKMRSIAIPAIGSGILAVPRNNCVEEYYKAAMSFSRNYPFKILQEIHFVDRDESMVRAIQEKFQSKETSKSTLQKFKNPGKAKDLPTGGAEYSAQSVMLDSNLYTIVHVSENFQVKIHLGKVTDVAADAIVCPQDEYLSSKDDIAVEIFKKLSCKPKSSNKKMNHGEISSQSLHGNFPWKLIIHAVTPRYDCDYSKDSMKFGAVLKTLIQNIIEAADGANIGSVAIPLIGAGKDDFNTPVDICASNFFKAVMGSKSKVLSLKDIYIVLDDENTEKMYLESFKHDCKITSRAVSNVENSKTLTGLPAKEEGNCCICMDEVTDPKRLKKCGHIFCKECIEQYFKYKPACPSCGQIYGKMTGDQPPGSIMIRNDFQQRLEGFSDSAGCIILTYTFQSGRQGPEHSEQGKWYQGISRSGYVPNNEKGRLVAKLLNVAFSRRLVFTIGRSRTTGHDGVITWNDFHHKTRIYGGPARFGYPDPTYLDRVLEELEAKGVTEESADDPEEYKEYSRQFGNR